MEYEMLIVLYVIVIISFGYVSIIFSINFYREHYKVKTMEINFLLLKKDSKTLNELLKETKRLIKGSDEVRDNVKNLDGITADIIMKNLVKSKAYLADKIKNNNVSFEDTAEFDKATKVGIDLENLSRVFENDLLKITDVIEKMYQDTKKIKDGYDAIKKTA